MDVDWHAFLSSHLQRNCRTRMGNVALPLQTVAPGGGNQEAGDSHKAKALWSMKAAKDRERTSFMIWPTEKTFRIEPEPDWNHGKKTLKVRWQHCRRRLWMLEIGFTDHLSESHRSCFRLLSSWMAAGSVSAKNLKNVSLSLSRRGGIQALRQCTDIQSLCLHDGRREHLCVERQHVP